jgi:uncharacterized ferritin-like protein (DUF455 family)
MLTENVYCPLCVATNTPVHLMLKGRGLELVPHVAAAVSEDKDDDAIAIVELLRIPVPTVVVP